MGRDYLRGPGRETFRLAPPLPSPRTRDGQRRGGAIRRWPASARAATR
ncbi:hypothetical protein [Lysobacter gummosus]